MTTCSLGRNTILRITWILVLFLLFPVYLEAQYFGKNKVRYQDFDFRIRETEHFDIYYYDDTEASVELIAKLAERWYDRLSDVMDHELGARQPLIIYATHTHFRQTNTTMGHIGEGTGGFTEALKNRVVLPMTGNLADFDHVLGHELIHAFQFDMTGRRGDPEGTRIPGATRLPLWLVEGMAEYLSLGPDSSLTSMWMRDAVQRDDLPALRRLNHPRFNPYRYGHALMAYIGGRWGDDAVTEFMRTAVRSGNLNQATQNMFDLSAEEFSEQWHEALRSRYRPLIEASAPADTHGRQLRPGRDDRGRRSANVAPALSPDGQRLVYLSERQGVAMELFMMDVESGEVIRRFSEFALDPHFESLQFVSSAGSWSPDNRHFVFAAVLQGVPALTILDTETGRVVDRIRFPELGEVYNPAWSPDGRHIAFSGQDRGFTDLYLYDTEQENHERLTEDRYSALQPAWSPDSGTIAYVTDRFSSDPDLLFAGVHQIALLNLESQAIREIPQVPGSKQINPQWSADGANLYYLSDSRGTSNLYRVDLASGATEALSNVHTGISGFTGLSPALSVAGPDDTIAFSAFDAGGFGLFVTDPGSLPESSVLSELTVATEDRLLPPLERTDQKVAEFLAEPARGLIADPVRRERDYRARPTPDFISQVHIGAAAGAGGTAAGGGATVYWTDMLGDHHLLTQLELHYQEGELVRNTAASVTYENRSQRFNWGVNVSQIPFISAGFRQTLGEVDGESAVIQQALRYWEVNRNVTGSIFYPLSQATRLETSLGYRYIGFDGEQRTRAFSASTGRLLAQSREELTVAPSLDLFRAGVAHVFDTALFGATSPMLGQRSRLQLTAVGGDLRFTEALADYRAYWMPFEDYGLSLAGRAMHLGRYGGDAESPRQRPLFIGSPSMVRGYDQGFSLAEEPVLASMQGSRMAVANLEARYPLTGSRGLVGGDFTWPADLALFYDTGTAWNSGTSFLGADRSLVSSYGLSLRTNLAGMVFQFSYVRPLDTVDRDWRFQFTIQPGF